MTPADPYDDRLPAVGRVLCGKWRLERLLGTGGMSSVYAATHRNGKRAAIKVLRRELAADGRTRRRFLREGYIANRVGSRCAPSVLDDDVDEDDGTVFLVMELLDGQTLDDLRVARGGTLPAAEVAWLAERLLAMLSQAHESGIVHRDLKPSNVFLTTHGELKLLDFGIARVHELTSVVEHTRTGVLLGTPAFMAPEQARGHWGSVDARTDIWAVGATLYRLLTGRLIHETTTSNEMMIATATVPPPLLSVHCPELPEAIKGVVDRALRLSPDERWQSAREMLGAVGQARGALEPFEGPVRPVAAPPRAMEPTEPEGASRGDRTLPTRPGVSATSWDSAPERTSPSPWSRANLGLALVALVALVGLALVAVRGTTGDRAGSARPTSDARATGVRSSGSDVASAPRASASPSAAPSPPSSTPSAAPSAPVAVSGGGSAPPPAPPRSVPRPRRRPRAAPPAPRSEPSPPVSKAERDVDYLLDNRR